MPELEDIFQTSNTLKCEDLMGKDWSLTIRAVEIKQFEENGTRKTKPILSFNETEKTLVCNKTNAMTIGEHHGFNTDFWNGKQITVYPTKTDFGGRIVDCIRVRPPMAGMAQQAPIPNAGHPNAPQPQPQPGGLDDEIPFAPEIRG